MSTEPVVIVGASLGGLRTAEALRRAGYAGPVRVIGDEVHAPYNRPPLSKEVLTAGVTHQAVAFPARESTADVEWMLGARAIGVDLPAQTVILHDGTAVRYGDLVIATGLRPRRLPLPFLSGRHAIRTLDDAMALRSELVPGARVVVAGSGFIGCEVAATATKLGCAVTVVSPSDEPLIRPLGRLLGAEIRRRHQARGIVFRRECRVVGFEGADRLTGVVLDDGSVEPADVLVEAIGCEPNTGW
ncbi:MAG: NAD(P)/FAD-dependent oxidoreductase, partial [Microbacteriaceae bacterium]